LSNDKNNDKRVKRLKAENKDDKGSYFVKDLSMKFERENNDLFREDDGVLKDLTCIFTIVIASLVLVTCISSSQGAVGLSLKNSLTYLLGSFAFLFPLIVMIFCFYMLLAKKSFKDVRAYIIYTALGYISFLSLLHGINMTFGENKNINNSEIYNKTFSEIMSMGMTKELTAEEYEKYITENKNANVIRIGEESTTTSSTVNPKQYIMIDGVMMTDENFDELAEKYGLTRSTNEFNSHLIEQDESAEMPDVKYYVEVNPFAGLLGVFVGSVFMSILGKGWTIFLSFFLMLLFSVSLVGWRTFKKVFVAVVVVQRRVRKNIEDALPHEEQDEEDEEEEQGFFEKLKNSKLLSFIIDYLNDDDDDYNVQTASGTIEEEYAFLEDENPKDYSEIEQYIYHEEVRQHEKQRQPIKGIERFMSQTISDVTASDISIEEESFDSYEDELDYYTNLIHIPSARNRFAEEGSFSIPINTEQREQTERTEIPRPDISDDENSDSFDSFDSFDSGINTEIDILDIPKTRKIESVPKIKEYRFPSLLFLNKNPATFSKNYRLQAEETKANLQKIFEEYKVDAKVIKYFRGPTVTRYEISPGQGVKVSKISGLADEIALKLASHGIRIEAPIPGKAAVGIEIPNKEPQPVFLREVIGSKEFKEHPSKVAFAVGKDIEGNVIVSDIKEMPHLLIAGATGSGKSVCVNTIITSIIYRATPKEVKLIMIDPKVVELSVYNGIPHLMIPVVTDPKKAAGALLWAVNKMNERYKLFSEHSVRNIEGYNESLKEHGDEELLPQIIIIIDELADLMQTSSSEVEESIQRLSQMARAAGIYLIIATQRPSVDVLTGVIKANIPSRLAFAVSSGTDSRTILDTVGAEKLLGRGDMLFYPNNKPKPIRVQGAFITDKEVEKIVEFVKAYSDVTYTNEMIEEITSVTSDKKSKDSADDDNIDELYNESVKFVVEKGKASASSLQRQFRIGYNRASRIMDELETTGVVGGEQGSRARDILIKPSEIENFLK